MTMFYANLYQITPIPEVHGVGSLAMSPIHSTSFGERADSDEGMLLALMQTDVIPCYNEDRSGTTGAFHSYLLTDDAVMKAWDYVWKLENRHPGDPGQGVVNL